MQRNRFAGFQTSGKEDSLELVCLGIPSTIFDDQPTATFIDEERHLQDWFGDKSVRVDRFDVRLLLDTLRDFDEPSEDEGDDEDDDERASRSKSQRTSVAEEEEEEEALCNTERFRDLHPATRETSIALEKPEELNGLSVEDDASNDDDEDDGEGLSDVARGPCYAGSRGYEENRDHKDEHGGTNLHHGPAFGFAYDADVEGTSAMKDDIHQHPDPGPASGPEDRPTTSKHDGEESRAFRPPFAVPTHLSDVVPSSEKQHKILVETARFVRTNGGQVEVLLRVKQAKNPAFKFLEPGHALHPYYRWVLDTDPQELFRDAAPSALNSNTAEALPMEPSPLECSTTEAQQSIRAVEHRTKDLQLIQDSTALALPWRTQSNTRLNTTVHTSLSAASLGPGDRPSTVHTSLSAASLGPGDRPSTVHTLLSAASLGPGDRPSTVSTNNVPVNGSLPLNTNLKPTATVIPRLPLVALMHQPEREASPEPCAPGLEDPEGVQHGVSLVISSTNVSVGTSELQGDCVTPPPEEIKGIIDKLASFVSRNGPRFEATVRERESGNPKFSFLLPWSPHHGYYLKKKQEFDNKIAVSSSRVEEVAVSVAKPAGALGRGGGAAESESSQAAQSTDDRSMAAREPDTVVTEAAESVVAGEIAMKGEATSTSIACDSEELKSVIVIKSNPKFHNTTRQGPAQSSAVPSAQLNQEDESSMPRGSVSNDDKKKSGNVSISARTVPLDNPEASIVHTSIQSSSGSESMEQLLKQRRERARALLLVKKAEARKKEEEAKRKEEETLRQYTLDHRKALLQLRSLLSAEEEVGVDVEGEAGGYEASRSVGSSMRSGYEHVPTVTQALDLGDELEEGEVVEEEDVGELVEVEEEAPSLRQEGKDTSFHAGSLSTFRNSGNGIKEAAMAEENGSAVPSSHAPPSQSASHDVAVHKDGHEKRDGIKRSSKEERHQKKSKKHKKHRGHARSSSEDDVSHRGCDRKRRKKRDRKRSRSSSSTGASDVSEKSVDKGRGRARGSREAPIPMPISLIVLDDHQEGQRAPVPNTNPTAGSHPVAPVDLRLRVRQMLLGLK
ncbi:hypothetical protein CEUSTIGMA_g3914.t1 [Chlamydomonas eustigma]|uniref:SURP motif domain-containing protein n=1 Tax=Chlamydomonas eustigma TaxID=1157962 RepID=A0A250X0J8_9CHLO|nr:hypothetical protein CEUSTIGMA_g3914.t1 [Chlamydomonas eustigma]|eukprot:GAX76469.1 hypothetical protein CEUSTIGMA_g3914.t1 [Chlamydomonas eustigma]